MRLSPPTTWSAKGGRWSHNPDALSVLRRSIETIPVPQGAQICPKEVCLLAKLRAREAEILKGPLLGRGRDRSGLKRGNPLGPFTE